MRKIEHGLIISAAVLAFVAIGSLELRSTIDPRSSAPVLYPLLIYCYNARWILMSLLVAAVLACVWIWRNARKRAIAAPLVIIILVFSCRICVSTANDEFDFLDLRYTLVPYDSIQVQNHVYHLALEDGWFGFGGGILFECDSLGFQCQNIHREVWGTETRKNVPKPPIRLEAGSSAVSIVYGDEILYAHPLS